MCIALFPVMASFAVWFSVNSHLTLSVPDTLHWTFLIRYLVPLTEHTRSAHVY